MCLRIQLADIVIAVEQPSMLSLHCDLCQQRNEKDEKSKSQYLENQILN